MAHSSRSRFESAMMPYYHRRVCRWLSELGFQHTEEYPVGPYSLDIFLPEIGLAIEVDGPHHGLRRKQDIRRDDWLEAQGIKVARLRVGRPKAALMELLFATATISN